MAQSGIILNVQHHLEDILNNQQLMLQNQHDMIEKLSDIESRLLDLEARCTLNQRNILIGNNGHSIKKNINNSHHLLYKLNNNNKSHLYNNIKNEANNSEANNSDNNSTNNYDQDFNNEEQVDRINDNDNDTYNENNENNESMGSNNDSLEYNDQSQQSLNMSNNFASNPNINLNNPNLLCDTEVKRIFSLAKSRGNFAALIVQQLYGKHERVISNVMGTRGKRQLSPRRINIVKKLTFNMYPAASQVEEEMMWKKECVKAIDSKNRKVKLEPVSFDDISRAAGIQAMTNINFQQYQMN